MCLCAVWLVTPGCVRGIYNRVNVNEPRSETAVSALRAGETELQEALDSLGAPNLVWPTSDGTALAWAHTHERGWGLRLSVPIRQFSANFDYRSNLAKAEAIALFFDEDWKLEYLRRGALADLLDERPRRVQPVEPERQPSAP